MPLTSIPYIIILGFIYGSSLIASRFSVGQYHPTNYIALRMLFASMAYIALYTFSRRYTWPKDPRLWRRAAVVGVFGTAIPMTAVVSAMQYQSSGLTAVLLTTSPAITVVMAHFALPDESLTRRKSIGVALALGGAVLIAILGESGLPDVSQPSTIGYGLVFMGILFSTATSIFTRKYLQDYKSFDIASIRMFFATLALLPLTVIMVGFDLSQVNSQGYFALGYASIMGTFSGTLLAVYIIQRFGATAVSMTTYVIPIVTVIGGTAILGERITPDMLLGVGLIVSGIAIINRRGKRELKKTSLVPYPDHPTGD